MMKFLNKKRKIGNKGFSLVELIIVIAIMAVLMAVLAPQLIKYVEKSRVQSDDSAASELTNVVRIAVSNEEIYTLLDGTDSVVWVGATGDITVTGPAADQLRPEIAKTLGLDETAPEMEVKANTHKTQNYTINIELDDDNTPVIKVIDWTPTP